MKATVHRSPVTTNPLTAATDWLERRHMELRERRQEASLRELERDLGKLVEDRVNACRMAAIAEAIGTADLAEAVGASPTSSAFPNNRGRLRSLGLIDYPSAGAVRAAGMLFPGNG